MACDLCRKPFGEACEAACLRAANSILQANAEKRSRNTGGHRNWPQMSDAAGCMPHEVELARSEARKHGVPTEFHRNGQAIFTSMAHKRKYLALKGWRQHSDYMR